MRIIKLLIFFTICAAFISCEDIIEEDITNDLVVITYPQNNQQIESNVVNFQWNELDGASDYRIQVQSGQFIVLDSLVSSNNFTYELDPGTYKWRIRGENFAYKTEYTFPVEFTLIETGDLSNQQVILVSPSNNIYTQNINPTFSWNGITAASSYDFELLNVTAGNNIVHQAPGQAGTSYTLPNSVITQDGQFLWRVRAKNADTQTNFTSRTFYIDRTPPNQPQNVSPANDVILNDGTIVNFSWNAPTDTGPVTSSVQFTIQIATDQNFNNIIQTDNTSVSSYQYTFNTVGNYYWRVKSKDLAGNESVQSSFFKIVIQ
jgi:hypothetical protein